jgi:putative ABC transport system substrate-binding protein
MGHRAHAQPKPARIGFLANATPVAKMTGPNPANNVLRPLLHGLRELGLVEGRNIVIERRSAEGHLDRIPALLRELAELRVDVLAIFGTATTRAAKREVTTIPIVAIMGDPVQNGIVTSLAHPDGNITGVVTEVDNRLDGKRLQYLKQLLPRASRISFLRIHPRSGSPLWLPETEAAARGLGLTLEPAWVDAPEDIDAAFAGIVRNRPDALFIDETPLNAIVSRSIIDFAARERLPAMFGLRSFAEAGGLMSYGGDFEAASRLMAKYVAKILKGVPPRDLPIEQVNRYELVINIETARSLGLNVPRALLLLADHVIE